MCFRSAISKNHVMDLLNDFLSNHLGFAGPSEQSSSRTDVQPSLIKLIESVSYYCHSKKNPHKQHPTLFIISSHVLVFQNEK